MKNNKMKFNMLLSIAIVSWVMAAGPVRQSDARLAPKLLNYQGFLTDTLGNPITNSSLSLSFAIFDNSSSGNQKWTETQGSVSVDKGIFNVLLGSITPIPDSVFTNSTDRWLELTVAGQVLSPRTRVVSAGYAYTATYSDTAQYARNSTPDNDWNFLITDGADTTLQTGGQWGLARLGNVLYGNADSTHVNLGVACTTGVSGQDYKYCTVGGGFLNVASGNRATVSGGYYNFASGNRAFVGGGVANAASNSYSAVAGGWYNTASGYGAHTGGGSHNAANGDYSVVGGGQYNTASDSCDFIGGGYYNHVASKYSSIPGGYADTIFAGADYCYLFGINSNLTQDSTFMIDMPHTWFGDETTGYEFPRQRGLNGQVMVTDASGQLSWSTAAASDTDWIITGTDMYSGVSGNVGVGTTTPRYNLDVNGIICGGTADTVNAVFGGILSGNSNLAGIAAGDTAATVVGGLNNSSTGKYTFVGNGWNNSADSAYSFVGGGVNNHTRGRCAVISGGQGNTASGASATVGGGIGNNASSMNATVGGGYINNAIENSATISGGRNNTASGAYATVSGGFYSTASANYATVGGGNYNYNAGDYSVIAGGCADTITASGDYSFVFGINSNLTQDSTIMLDMPHVLFGTEAAGYEFPRQRGADGQVMVTNSSGQLSWVTVSGGADSDWSFCITDGADTTLQSGGRWGLARAGNILYGNADSTHVNLGVACTTGTSGIPYKYCTVGGGYFNTASGNSATVGGGYNNSADTSYATVGGGSNNTASGNIATVGGGWSNTASGYSATVGGGYNNSADTSYATVGGGYDNIASGNYATVGGGYSDDANGYISGVGSGANNLAGNAISDTGAVVAGGLGNVARKQFSFVGGGKGNSADTSYTTVGGGWSNTASGSNATVGGGYDNIASGNNATVGGGHSNSADTSYATVGGGWNNTASGHMSTVVGGSYNTAYATYATVGGGWQNISGAYCATVAGGYADTAAAYYSFTTNYSTKVNAIDTNSAAFTTSHTTAKNQVRAAAFSTGTVDYAMDHPDDPMNKILNQYGVSSDEVQSQYSGSIILNDNGRAMVNLPDYFDDINRNPRIQLTGVGSSDVYVAEDIAGNRFVIGGKPNIKVYWEVTAERKDIHAEIARIQTPVVQEKKGDLRGHSIDDDAMIGMYDGLHQKNPALFQFKTEEGRGVHEQSKRMIEETENR